MASPAASICELIQQKNPSWTGEWSGDVWKAVVHLRSLHQDLCAFVLDCDTGVGVVTRWPARSRLAYSEDQIRELDYNDLAANRHICWTCGRLTTLKNFFVVRWSYD